MIAPINDWADRWLGGFCAVGALGGLPVRGPDYHAHPPLDQILSQPELQASADADLRTAHDAWFAALGGVPVVLLRNLQRARSLLMQALAVTEGAPVGVPANATRELTEAVKQYPALPRFLDLGPEMAPGWTAEYAAGMQVLWVQPYGGAWATALPRGYRVLVDAGDSLPDFAPVLPEHGAVLYGLHLHTDPRRSGALLICSDTALAQAVEALASEHDMVQPGLALARLQQLYGPHGLVARQQASLAATRLGLQQAAGLPLLEPAPGVLANSIALRVPEPCDAATFYAYVLGEQTPVRWLPAQRPLHYAALREDGASGVLATAAQLNRVLLVPVGPDYSEEELKHAVLGITKAADYLGIRWYTDPARAHWYAQQMLEWYGPHHDAYRMLFPR